VVFKATVTDPDGGAVMLEVQLWKENEPQNTATTYTSDFYPSGSTARVTVAGLYNDTYLWQARTRKVASVLWSDWVPPGDLRPNLIVNVVRPSQLWISKVASEVRRALAEGTFKPAENQKPVPTLKEYSERWLDTYVKGSLKPKTQEDYRAVFKLHLLPALGHKRLDEISRADVKELVFAKQAADLSANTIRLIRAPSAASLPTP
jgi:hypothetical protein